MTMSDEEEQAEGAEQHARTSHWRRMKVGSILASALLAFVGVATLASPRSAQLESWRSVMFARSGLWGQGGDDITLFCFAVMQIDGYELPVMETQRRLDAGVFACDDQMVFSDEEVDLGSFMTTPIGDVHNQLGGQGPLATGSWVNTHTFFHAWRAVRRSERYLDFAWTVKADPDTVFLPSILRQHLRQKGLYGNPGAKTYLNNCPNVDNGFYGSLEVISRVSFMAFMDNMDVCRQQLDFRGWGEDLFCQKCMDSIGAAPTGDYDLVSDGNCHGAGGPVPCIPGKPAYHPFKGPEDWQTCWQQVGGHGGQAVPLRVGQKQHEFPGIIPHEERHEFPGGEVPRQRHRFPIEELERNKESSGWFVGLPSFHRRK